MKKEKKKKVKEGGIDRKDVTVRDRDCGWGIMYNTYMCICIYKFD